MKKAFGFSIAATVGFGCLSITPAANAGVILWDQPPDASKGATAFVDQHFGDFASFATFLVSDVVFGGAVKISSITTYYTKGASDSDLWPADAFGTATLNIFADPLSNALHDPFAGASVEVFYAVTPDGFAVTASGLNIDLAAGTYWIGLTPELDFLVFDQEFHRVALNSTGGPTMARNPGLGFGFGPDWFDAGLTFPKVPIENWDASITIVGIPTPGALALLGVAGLATRRRRRR